MIRLLARSTICVLALATSVVSVQVVTERPADAVQIEFRIDNFNMQSNSTGVALVTFLANINPQPFFISLTEICEQDFFDLKANLSGQYYAPNFIPSFFFHSTATRTASACGGDYFGNAIFAVGAPNGALGSEVLDPAGNERREISCQAMSTFVGGFNACVTHIDPNANAIAGQITEAHDHTQLVNLIIPGLTVTSGDFNADHQRSELAAWRSNYYRVNKTQDTWKVPNPSYLIDISWGHKSDLPGNIMPRTVYCNSFYSDHCHVANGFMWNV